MLPAADRPKVGGRRRATALVRRALRRAVGRSGLGLGAARVLVRGLGEAGAGGELALSAAEYPGGALDWHSFDVAAGRSSAPSRPTKPAADVVRTVMPAPVRYSGMAADRWWQFEDAQVNLNRIEGDPDELMRLLLVEFALLTATTGS